MGISTSKDKRRISFENTFAVTPPLALQKIDEPAEMEVFQNAHKSQEALFTNDIDIQSFDADGDGDYWGRRIEKLKKEHQIINNIMETEYELMLQKTKKKLEVEPKIPKAEKIKKLEPCLDLEAKMLQCYQENLRKPLVCSSAVRAFNECVGHSFAHASDEQ